MVARDDGVGRERVVMRRVGLKMPLMNDELVMMIQGLV